MNELYLDTNVEAYLTDEKGSLVLDDAGQKIRIARDVVTGQFFKKIADQLPTEKDSKSVALRESIVNQNPVHSSAAGGYWIPVDYKPLAAAAEK